MLTLLWSTFKSQGMLMHLGKNKNNILIIKTHANTLQIINFFFVITFFPAPNTTKIHINRTDRVDRSRTDANNCSSFKRNIFSFKCHATHQHA